MKKRIAFILTTTILLAVIFFCFSTTAYSQSVEKAAMADKAGVDVMERGLLQTIWQIMEEHGCTYSGVTMTKTYTEDGGRIYRVAVHHRNLAYLDEAELKALEEELQQITKGWEQTEFCYEFTYSS